MKMVRVKKKKKFEKTLGRKKKRDNIRNSQKGERKRKGKLKAQYNFAKRKLFTALPLRR